MPLLDPTELDPDHGLPLLRLIAGLLVPSDGRISVCGLDTRSQPQALRAAAAYMPQRFGLYEDLSVIENLQLYADLRSVVGTARHEAFAKLLEFTGLAPQLRLLYRRKREAMAV
jgi:ABC-2 type transport system ATP-binding protein